MSFFSRDDPQYDSFVARYQAKLPAAKILYLFLHLLPGIAAYALINVSAVHDAALRLTGIPDNLLQYAYLIAFTFGWHMLVPLLTLRWADKLSFRESIAFLSLNRLDARGVFLVMPVVFVAWTAISLPYIKYVFPALQAWVSSIPGLSIPAYSIFQDDKYFAFPPLMLVFLGIGNFLGEELYFRGYLLKKVGFLGDWAWLVNSLLFDLYHLWQAPTTWAIIGLVPVFGLLMQWRKSLYPLIFFHLLVNILWGNVILARLT